MTLHQADAKIEITCDDCDKPWPMVHDAEDLDVLVADVKSAGWQIYRRDGEWRHRCPDCRFMPFRRLL
jgi:hypothetical protein